MVPFTAEASTSEAGALELEALGDATTADGVASIADMGRRPIISRWVPTPSLMLVGVALIIIGLLAGNFLTGFINRVALLIVQLVFAVVALAVMAWVGRYLLHQGRSRPGR